MKTLQKKDHELTPASIRDAVFANFPSMARAKKIKLSTQMIPALQVAATSAELLSMEPLSLPDPIRCDIADDYMILRDEDNESIADVYVGNDANLKEHVVFNNGESLSKHQRLLLQGHELVDGYLDECDCTECTKLKVAKTLEHDSKLLKRDSNHVLTVNLPRELKIRDTSDRLLNAMRDSEVSDNDDFKPRVFAPNNMRREGSVSYPIENQ